MILIPVCSHNNRVPVDSAPNQTECTCRMLTHTIKPVNWCPVLRRGSGGALTYNLALGYVNVDSSQRTEVYSPFQKKSIMIIASIGLSQEGTGLVKSI